MFWKLNDKNDNYQRNNQCIAPTQEETPIIQIGSKMDAKIALLEDMGIHLEKWWGVLAIFREQSTGTDCLLWKHEPYSPFDEYR